MSYESRLATEERRDALLRAVTEAREAIAKHLNEHAEIPEYRARRQLLVLLSAYEEAARKYGAEAGS